MAMAAAGMDMVQIGAVANGSIVSGSNIIAAKNGVEIMATGADRYFVLIYRK
jgi:hypothetical protein